MVSNIKSKVNDMLNEVSETTGRALNSVHASVIAVTPDRGILSDDTWRENFSFCKGKYVLFE
jgi:hypothetical protein